MFKKTSFSLLNVWLEGLSSPASQQQPGSKDLQGVQAEQIAPKANSSELKRIASALERIACALEKIAPPEPSISPITQPSPPSVTPTAPSPPPAPENQPVRSTSPGVLLPYLETRNVTVQPPKTEVSAANKPNLLSLERLAFYLGKDYAECEALYKLLRSNLAAPRAAFSYSLKGATITQNAVVRDFVGLLREAELLEEHHYQGKPDYIFQLKANGKEQKFLTGAWLESFVRQEIARLTQLYTQQTKSVPYEALGNLYLTFQDNSKAELDLLFAVGRKVFCVETKMRPGLADLKNFLVKIQPLKLDPSAVLIVVADKTPEECQKLRQELGKTRLIRLAELEQSLTAILETTLAVKN